MTKPRKPASTRVLTVNMKDTTKATDDRVIDMNRQSHKTWLTKHIEWAARNGHGVQISPES